MIAQHFDQEAIDRYISSQVADNLATIPSKAEGLELPFTGQDVFVRDFLVQHYPVGSTYSEFPMWINRFCDIAIEMSKSAPKPRAKNSAYLRVETSIYVAEHLMNTAITNAKVAATLMAVEVDKQGLFNKALTEAEAEFQNHMGYLRARHEIEKKHYPDRNKEILISKIEAAVGHYLSEVLTRIKDICGDMKNLISAHA